MAFDLAEALKGVSVPNTQRERFAYLPYAALIPDENNGYSMTGIEELARSIELVGLQQPPRVKDQGDGTYKLISGHRRLAAIGAILQRDPKAFADGIPCVIDAPGGSEALRELQLLLANADNRKLTPADDLQQKQRISDCLRRLENEGFKFPGRHRDWVSKMSGMSRSKIARLEAIENNLVTGLLDFFLSGNLTETAAYELQKLPEDAQTAIAESCKRGGDASFITADAAGWCVEHAEKFMAPLKCKNGDACDHHARRFVQPLRSQHSWARCDGGCCLKCRELESCKAPCDKGRAKQKADKAAEKAENEKRKAERDRESDRQQAEARAKIQAEASRLLPLIEAAGLDGRNTLPGHFSYLTLRISEVRDFAAGNFRDNDHHYDSTFLPYMISDLKKWADALHCSLDYLVGRSDEPRPVSTQDTTQEWYTGEPTKAGAYWAEVQCGRELKRQAARWSEDVGWKFYNIDATFSAPVLRWHPLPEED